MNGDGTQDNPYQITTFAELSLNTYNDSSSIRYLKIMNDINILDEFSKDTVPSIATRNVDIDGNGKTISNWNKSSGYMVDMTYEGSYSKFHDLNFNNIDVPSSATAFMCGNNQDGFVNCSFRGQINNYFASGSSRHSYGPVKFKSCVFKIKDVRTGSVSFNTSDKGIYLDSCYFEYDSTSTGVPFDSASSIDDTQAIDSYFKMKIPNLSSAYLSNWNLKFKNCALEITTDYGMGFVSDNSSISIFNSTKGPNITSTYGVGITDANWLNLEALEQAGFNVVPSE